MPLYVYGCKKCGNTEQVVHGMTAPVMCVCGQCGEWMSKIPQRFRFGRSPKDILGEHIDEGFRKYKIRKAKEKKNARTNKSRIRKGY